MSTASDIYDTLSTVLLKSLRPSTPFRFSLCPARYYILLKTTLLFCAIAVSLNTYKTLLYVIRFVLNSITSDVSAVHENV